MSNLRFVALFAVAACGPETTSFRNTDEAAQVLPNGVQVHVWSNGGYIGSSDEPMTHAGFEIRNAGTAPVVFDSELLGIEVFDKYGEPLPATRFVSITPLGPAQVAIPAGTTTTLDAYFLLPVQPRVVDTMRVRWSLRIGDARATETTHFVRDDRYPVSEPPARVDHSNRNASIGSSRDALRAG